MKITKVDNVGHFKTEDRRMLVNILDDRRENTKKFIQRRVKL